MRWRRQRREDARKAPVKAPSRMAALRRSLPRVAAAGRGARSGLDAKSGPVSLCRLDATIVPRARLSPDKPRPAPLAPQSDPRRAQLVRHRNARHRNPNQCKRGPLLGRKSASSNGVGKMPRGSKPGERRGGRQRGTPNKSTLLKHAAIKAAATDPNLSPLEFLLKFMRQSRFTLTASGHRCPASARDADSPPTLRLRVAGIVAPHVHRKGEPVQMDEFPVAMIVLDDPYGFDGSSRDFPDRDFEFRRERRNFHLAHAGMPVDPNCLTGAKRAPFDSAAGISRDYSSFPPL